MFSFIEIGLLKSSEFKKMTEGTLSVALDTKPIAEKFEQLTKLVEGWNPILDQTYTGVAESVSLDGKSLLEALEKVHNGDGMPKILLMQNGKLEFVSVPWIVSDFLKYGTCHLNNLHMTADQSMLLENAQKVLEALKLDGS